MYLPRRQVSTTSDSARFIVRSLRHSSYLQPRILLTASPVVSEDDLSTSSWRSRRSTSEKRSRSWQKKHESRCRHNTMLSNLSEARISTSSTKRQQNGIIRHCSSRRIADHLPISRIVRSQSRQFASSSLGIRVLLVILFLHSRILDFRVILSLSLDSSSLSLGINSMVVSPSRSPIRWGIRSDSRLVSSRMHCPSISTLQRRIYSTRARSCMGSISQNKRYRRRVRCSSSSDRWIRSHSIRRLSTMLSESVELL